MGQKKLYQVVRYPYLLDRVEKNSVSCIFCDLHPIITGTVTDTMQKTGKYSLDGKTQLHSHSYYINEEAYRI